FAGDEALGKVNPNSNPQWYAKRGSNRNVIANNDFSYAAAHGVEMTFSFGNRILQNRLVGNAICGVWGGYSQASFIAQNTFESNGDMPYGSERGGINIEHGRSNYISGNTFRNNPCGVFLWWDRDAGILKLPWAAANSTAVEDNAIMQNTFDGDRIAVQLRRVGPTTMGSNVMTNVAVEVDADEASAAFFKDLGNIDLAPSRFDVPEPVGRANPVGARADLQGREHIIMTEWGPYDWQEPLLTADRSRPDRHVFRLVGREPLTDATLMAPAGVKLIRDDTTGRLVVTTEAADAVLPYELTAMTASGEHSATGALVTVAWDVLVFASGAKPRQDADAWRRQARANGVPFTASRLHLQYGTGGPSGMDLDPAVTAAALPADHFGTIAVATMSVPAGRWRIRTNSDDGIRVWIDDDLVIDDWTWHPPRTHDHRLELEQPKKIVVRVEHFELDGYAILSLDLEPLTDTAPSEPEAPGTP
ncbi:MAG: PA14 domain-containing protein, partial [Planctomycetota bacterium]